MSKKQGTALTAALAAVMLCCCGVAALPIILFGSSVALACGGSAPELGTPAVTPVGDWNATQVAHAATIVSVGRQRQIPARGYVIALAVAMQESTLRNLANPAHPESLTMPHDGIGGDHDSLGLFQQRPSAGWGTVAQLMTPSYAAGAFYTALQRVDGWEQMRLTEAAQAVQRSAFPEAYQKWERDAEDLAAHVLGIPDIDAVGGGDPLAPCGLDAFGPVQVGPHGWVQPVRAEIVSPFGMRDGRLHAGVDLGASRGTPIHAAADGTVDTAACDASTGDCNRDGSPATSGCGWYVDIRHADNVVTRYCHMQTQPRVNRGDTVTAGQIIGFVGSSGHSSGPHLHYEVHLNVPPGPYHADGSNAIDPVPFMAAQAVPLGQP